MIRFLLTFLALVSGLSATGQASARSFADERPALAAVQVLPGKVRVSALVTAHAEALVRAPAPELPAEVAAMRPLPVLVAPVLVSVDRARE